MRRRAGEDGSAKAGRSAAGLRILRFRRFRLRGLRLGRGRLGGGGLRLRRLRLGSFRLRRRLGGLRSSGEFNNYFNGGVQYTEGLRVAMNHLQMAPPAHVAMLIEVPEGKDPEEFAKELTDDADPRWMICATANSVQAAAKDGLVLFVMSSEENANALIAAFKG